MRIKQVALASALLGAAFLSGQALTAAAQAQEDVVERRQAGLKEVGQRLGEIKKVVDAGGDVAPVVGHSEAMREFFTGFPALFPAGSDKGRTKASPAIWTDRAGFEAAAARILAATTKLNEAAKSGDAAATAAAFREAGSACGACHREYRLR